MPIDFWRPDNRQKIPLAAVYSQECVLECDGPPRAKYALSTHVYHINYNDPCTYIKHNIT